MVEFIKSKSAGIREIFGGEDFVQKLLAEDPSLLGLGDLYLRGKERVQLSSGRLDLLFESPDAKSWYEVEVQLGATDETHIIRTIEYWDNERKNYPGKQHVAVIVAERITSRFFNVIALFNQHIPIIAIQMNALELNGSHTITFTRILDHTSSVPKASVEEDFEPSDRAYWVKRTSEQSMKIADEILQFAKTEDPSSSIKYNKGYIAIKRVGGELRISNFMSIRPRKKDIRLSVISRKDEALEAKFSQASLNFEYEESSGQYFFYFQEADYERVRQSLREVLHFAYNATKNAPQNNLIGVEV